MVRRILAAALIAALPAGAQAADMLGAPLRGAYSPETVSGQTSWGGFHAGVTAGTAIANFNLARGVSTSYGLLNTITQGTPVQTGGQLINYFAPSYRSTVNKNAIGYGLFAGYSWTMDGAVLGIEADYTRHKLNAQRGQNITQTVNGADLYQYTWTGVTNADTQMTGVGTLRVRAGYAMDWIMPYLTAGLAVAQGKFESRANYSYTRVDISGLGRGPGSGSGFDKVGRAKNFESGIAVGLGAEFMLAQSMFLRAEMLHYRFGNFGNADITFNVARIGAGVHF